MALIAANVGRSQSELAEQAGLATPSMVTLVDELERLDMVRRVKSEIDRRRNDLVLTERGRETTEKLFSQVTQIEAPIREALGEKDFTVFVQMLDKAVAALRDNGPHS